MATLRCKPLIMLSLISLVLAGCSSHLASTDNVSSVLKNADGDAEVQEGHSAVLFMTDLEIIKRATDHLKKHGEKVAFEETEISVHKSEKKTLIFYDASGKAVIHKGDYMSIVLYPPQKPSNREYSKCFTVYLDQNGNTLGYTIQTINED
jgi:uncharacterized protein YcfL